jgi:hypothetical protein
MMLALDADYGVMGEGERIGLLIDAIENHQDASGIPGIVTRNCPGPMPAPWEEKYSSENSTRETDYLPYYLKNGGMLNLQTKRGCHFNCFYCTYPHIEGRRLRLAAPDTVAKPPSAWRRPGEISVYDRCGYFFPTATTKLRWRGAHEKARVTVPWGRFFRTFQPSGGFTTGF